MNGLTNIHDFNNMDYQFSFSYMTYHNCDFLTATLFVGGVTGSAIADTIASLGNIHADAIPTLKLSIRADFGGDYVHKCKHN